MTPKTQLIKNTIVAGSVIGVLAIATSCGYPNSKRYSFVEVFNDTVYRGEVVIEGSKFIWYAEENVVQGTSTLTHCTRGNDELSRRGTQWAICTETLTHATGTKRHDVRVTRETSTELLTITSLDRSFSIAIPEGGKAFRF